MTDMGVDSRSTLGLEAKFKALSSPYRRRVLNALASDHRLSDDDLVAMFDDDRSRSRRLIECRQVHLPILSDLGLIKRRDDVNQIIPGENFDVIEPFLDSLETLDPNGPRLPY